MKKIFTFVKNVVDTGLLGGVLSQKKANHPDAPAGVNNWGALIGGVVSSLAFLMLLYFWLTGKISDDQFQEGVNALPK